MAVKIRQRPKGSGIWWVFIDHKGKRKAKKIGKDKRLARQVAKKIEAKLALGDLDLLKEKKAVPSFEEYAEIWRSVILPATCKRSTIHDYEGILKNHVYPVFKKTPVTEINRSGVKRFLLKKIADGYAASTVTHMKNAISGPLNLALDEELISINPAHRLGKIFKTQDSKLKVDPLSREEVRAILECLKSDYSRFHPLALTLARTGLRLGEGLGLQWGDIDFNGRFILVRRNISRERIETPKSGKTRRVDMSKQLTSTLRELKHNRKLEVLKRGWKKLPAWVFVNENGERTGAKKFQRAFNAVLDKAGIRKVRVHDLRHAFASALLQAGESPAYVKEQLGHHSIKMTVDVYGHLVPGANRRAVDRLDDTEDEENRNIPQPIRNQKKKRG